MACEKGVDMRDSIKDKFFMNRREAYLMHLTYRRGRGEEVERPPPPSLPHRDEVNSLCPVRGGGGPLEGVGPENQDYFRL